MKSILMFASLTFLSPAHADYAETILSDLNLRNGQVLESTGDNEECLEGELNVTEVGPNAASIRIGAKLLVDAIGPGSNVNGPLDRCRTERPSEPIRNGRLAMTKTMFCPQRTFTWKYVIEAVPGGLKYTLQRGDKTDKCTLVAR